MKNLSLNFIKSGDTRRPLTIRITVEDDDSGARDADVDLTEHQFALLMSGSVIQVEDKR